MSFRQSSNNPTQSLKVPIFATFPGMYNSFQQNPLNHKGHEVSQRKTAILFHTLCLSRLLCLALSHIQPNCFHFCVVFDGMDAQLASKARTFVASERQRRVHEAVGVNPNRSGSELTRNG